MTMNVRADRTTQPPDHPPRSEDVFWEDVLAEAPRTSALEPQRPHRGAAGPVARVTVTVPAAVRSASFDSALRLNVPWPIWSLGALLVLLHKYGPATELVVGATVTGESGTSRIVPVRMRIRPDESVIGLLRRLQRAWSRLRQFAVPEVVLGRLWGPGPAGAAPPVRFTHSTGHRTGPAGDDRIGVHLEVRDLNGRTDVHVGFDTARFDRAQAELWADRYVALLETMPSQLVLPVRAIDLRTATDRAALTAANRDGRAWSGPESVLAAFSRRVAESPERLYLSDGAQELSYGDTARLAGELADELLRAGVGKGDVVGVDSRFPLDLVCGMLAAWQVDAVFAPVDPGLTGTQLAARLRAMRAGALLSARRCQVVDGGRIRPPGTDSACSVVGRKATGRLGYVDVSHRDLVNTVWSLADLLAVHRDDELLSLTRAAHGQSVIEYTMSLAAGGSVLLLGDRSPAEQQKWLRDRPDALALANADQWRALTPLRTVRNRLVVTYADTPAPGDVTTALLGRCAELWVAGGCTRAGLLSLAASAAGPGHDHTLMGLPLPGTAAGLLDDLGRDLPPGALGELWIRSPSTPEGSPGHATGLRCRRRSDGAILSAGSGNDFGK